MAQIQEWWETPQEEEEWADVSKKAPKKKQTQGGGGRGSGRGRGRNGAGGRGGGGRDRDRNGRGGGSEKPKKQAPAAKSEEPVKNGGKKVKAQPPAAAPPARPATAPKNAWGKRPPLGGASASVEPTKQVPQPKLEDITPPPEANPLEVGIVSSNDPTPSGLTGPLDTKPIKSTVASGNVWATKGSAHLIQAEKPKPKPIVPAKPPKSVEPQRPSTQVPEASLESGLPPTVGGGAWSKGAHSTKQPVSLDLPPASPASKGLPNGIPTVASIEEPVPVSPKVVVPPSPVAPTNVLNMGHWETGDADDAQNLDFAFGSFGTDNDAVDATTSSTSVPAAPQTSAKDVETNGVSPARPPPGLSLGNMASMPMVHELENKMESASLNAKKDPANERAPPAAAPAPVLPSVTQQNYSQYGMPGMYNYTAAASSGFVGMPGFAGGVVPQQPGKPQGGITGTTAQQGLYGTQPQSAPSSGNAAGTESTGDSAAAAPTPAGIPPGMPGAIPYANPALHYGQPQYYMGQHQGGIGYNYAAYGQFGGVAQGGFGYQQVMGQSQGYGAPHYDDQSHQGNHSGGSGGYQKNNGGGYRGRNSHHNNNQYQNQYNPGGYGGQPYGMGFQDHYNQRGGYGPAGMADPYGMQQGSGNYQSNGTQQDDDDQKGKKSGRGNGAFQQAPPPQLNGQQGFGLQGQGSETTPSTAAAGNGWSNQAGGWSGTAQGWQAS